MSYDSQTIGIQRKLDDAKRYWSINPFGFGVGASAMMALREAQYEAERLELSETIEALEHYWDVVSCGDAFATEHSEAETQARIRALNTAHLACFGAIAEYTADRELAAAS